jgi:Poxvirus A32 protein
VILYMYKYKILKIKKQAKMSVYTREESITMHIHAPRNSGKTTLLYRLLTTPHTQGGYGGFYDEVHLFSPNVNIDPKLKMLATQLKKERVYDNFDSSAINAILKSADGQKKILVILDDCMSEEGFSNQKGSNPLSSICTIGRNRKVSLIVITQSYVGLPKLARKNIDCYIVFGSVSESELKEVFHGELCLPWFKYKSFIRDYFRYTRAKYSFLVYNRSERECYAYDPNDKSYSLIANRDTMSEEARIESDSD